VLLNCFARRLTLQCYNAQATIAINFAILSVESVLPLCSLNYLGWRVQLYIASARSYALPPMMDFPSAKVSHN
jgi:hypothetical protein